MAKSRSRGGGSPVEIEISSVIDTSKVDAALAKLQATVAKQDKQYASLGNKLKIAWEVAGQGVNVARQAIENLSEKVGRLRGMMSGGWFGAGLKIATGMFVFDKIKDGLMAIPKMFWAAVNDASEAETIERKFKSVFDNLAPEALKFAGSFAKELGRSETEIKSVMSRFQDTLVPIGFGRKQSTDITKKMTRLSADLAASEGMSEQEAADRIVSGMVGNHEALRRFGVVITENSLKAELLSMGLAKGGRNATELEKAVARLNIVLNGTRDAQGMAGRAAGSFATESRALGGVWTDFSATLGKLVLPSLAKLTAFFRDLVSKMRISLGDTGSIGDSLGESFGKMLKLADPLKEKFVGIFQQIGPAIEFLADKAKQFTSQFGNWDGFVEAFRKAASQIGDTLFTTIKTAIAKGVREGLFGSPEVEKKLDKDRERAGRIYASRFGSGAIPIRDGAISNKVRGAALPSEKAKLEAQKSMDDYRATGNASGKSQWDRLSTAEKRKQLFQNAGYGANAGEHWLAEASDADLNLLMKLRAASDNVTGSDWAKQMLSPSDPQGPTTESWMNSMGIGQRQGKEQKITLDNQGGAFGMAAKGLTSGLASIASGLSMFAKTGNLSGPNLGVPNDPRKNRDKPKDRGTLSEWGNVASAVGGMMWDNVGAKKPIGSVQFMGLQDVQKSIQGQLGDDESKKDKLKLEVLRNIKEQAAKQVEGIGKVGSEVASAVTKMLGLQ